MDRLRRAYVALTWKLVGVMIPTLLVWDHYLVPDAVAYLKAYFPTAARWIDAEAARILTTGAIFVALVQGPAVAWRKWLWKITHARLDFSGAWLWTVEWEPGRVSDLPAEQQQEALRIMEAVQSGEVYIRQDALSSAVAGGSSRRDTGDDHGYFKTLALHISDESELCSCILHYLCGEHYVVVDQVGVVRQQRTGLRKGRPLKLEGRFPFVNLQSGVVLFGRVIYERSKP
jgi:hypothetical protein